ncbi:AraC family transcriptional regulator [Ferrovibrio sp.]|uniref:AraC family transcriptional regulator n=1 Tax=Ferrovibrio sp. TaxID=1917215 RepID=UPI003518F2C8
MATAIPRASLVPGMVPDEELTRLWQQSIGAYFDVRTFGDPPPGPQRHTIHQYHLGQALLIDASFTHQQFHRDPVWMARHDDSDHLGLQLYLNGSNDVENGDRSFRQRPGNVFAVNLSRETHAASPGGDTLTLMLPRDLLQAELPQLLDASGAIFEDDSAAALVFADHMRALRRHVDRATTAELPAIMQGTLGLLDALTRQRDIAAAPAQAATLAAICRHIDRHLDNPALDIESLCRAFSCSRATLYRLFKPLGGVREHIQRRRLVACYRAISAPAQRHRRIFDIALDYGFVSASHFSSLFRAQFGITPRQAREAAPRQADPGAAGSDGDPAALMRHWAKTLARPPGG